MNAPNLPTSHFEQVESLRLHHLDWGNPGLTPMVLLHGIRLHAHCWNDLSRRFCGAYRVLALDTRGHGDSEWSEAGDYHLHTLYEDLRAVMDALALPPAVLVGHSLGARTAMLYSHLHPERVSKLVLVDMAAGLPRAFGSEDFSRVTATPPPQDFASPRDAADYLSAILKQAPRHMIDESAELGLRQRADGRYVWKYDPTLGGAPRPLAGKRDWDLWQAVKTIDCPTLLLRGQNSRVVTAELAQRMSESMIDCRVECIADAGHALFTEQPQAFAECLGRFLEAGNSSTTQTGAP